MNGAGRYAVAVDSLGQASLTVSPLAPGTQSIAASYSGDANFSASTGECRRRRRTPSPADADPDRHSQAGQLPQPHRRPTPPSPNTASHHSARRHR